MKINQLKIPYFVHSLPTWILGLLLSIYFTSLSDAAILIAEYNFEETQPSTVVLDQVGPPYHNGTRFGGGDVNYGTFNGSQALDVDGVPNNAITLGQGVDGVFQDLQTQGFRLQLDFQITSESWNGPITLLSMSGGPGVSGGQRAFELIIFASNHASLAGKVGLNVSDPDTSAVKTAVASPGVTSGTPYRVIAEWDPTKDAKQLTLQIWDLHTDTLYGSGALNFAAESLFPSTAPVLIGRVDQADNHQTFQGMIDNVQIYQIIPEPHMAALLSIASVLALFFRVQQRSATQRL